MIEISEVIRPPSGSTISMSGSALNAHKGGISRMHPPNGFGIRQKPGMQNSGMCDFDESSGGAAGGRAP